MTGTGAKTWLLERLHLRREGTVETETPPTEEPTPEAPAPEEPGTPDEPASEEL